MTSTPLTTPANALREAEQGRQHELPLAAGNCFEELARRWQPRNQRLLERAALQPCRQLPRILRRHSMGQLLNFIDRGLTGQEEQEAETAQDHQVQQNPGHAHHKASPDQALNQWAQGCRKRKRDQHINDDNVELP